MEISHVTPAPTHVQRTLLSTSLTRVVLLLQLMDLHWFIITTRSPWFTLQFRFRQMYIMTYINHCSIIQRIFIVLKILWTLPVPPSHLFTVFIVLSFPECHIVGIVEYVTFSDVPLLPSYVHLSFLLVVVWLDSSFLFQHWILFHCLDAPQFTYLFTYSRISLLLPSVTNYE